MKCKKAHSVSSQSLLICVSKITMVFTGFSTVSRPVSDFCGHGLVNIWLGDSFFTYYSYVFWPACSFQSTLKSHSCKCISTNIKESYVRERFVLSSHQMRKGWEGKRLKAVAAGPNKHEWVSFQLLSIVLPVGHLLHLPARPKDHYHSLYLVIQQH